MTVALCVAWPAAARAAGSDAFNGQIAFTSFRVDPAGQQRSGDIFSMNADGTGLRRLTTNPDLDRQPDWSVDGRAIAYTIRKPGSQINYEVARMTAAGTEHRQLTTSDAGHASSQPSWLPGGRASSFAAADPVLWRASGRWARWARIRSRASRLHIPRCIRRGLRTNAGCSSRAPSPPPATPIGGSSR